MQPEVVTLATSPQAMPSLDLAKEIRHIIIIQETKCNIHQWYIAHLPKNLEKACFADHVNMKTKYTAKIVQENKSTPTIIYNGFMK